MDRSAQVLELNDQIGRFLRRNALQGLDVRPCTSDFYPDWCLCCKVEFGRKNERAVALFMELDLAIITADTAVCGISNFRQQLDTLGALTAQLARMVLEMRLATARDATLSRPHFLAQDLAQNLWKSNANETRLVLRRGTRLEGGILIIQP